MQQAIVPFSFNGTKRGCNGGFWAEQRNRAAVCPLAPSFASFEEADTRLIDLRRGEGVAGAVCV